MRGDRRRGGRHGGRESLGEEARTQCALLEVKASCERLDPVEPQERSGHEIRPVGIWAKQAVESVRNAEGGWCRTGGFLPGHTGA